jgi:hypothetical protein
MNDTLEFPEIAAPAPRTEVATAAAGALDLENINLTDLALAKFGDWRGKVAAVTANLGTLALDLSTQARVNDARSLRERLINVPRAEARKVSKALRSKFAATGKDVTAAEEQIIGAWDAAETLITPKIDTAQQALDAEKAEKARIEAERVRVHKERMGGIGAYLVACQAPGMTSERIARGIAMLSAATFGPEWEEFQVLAANLQCETLEAMRQLHAQVLGRELEAKRQEEIRAENERQAEANRLERERIEAEAAEIRRQAAALAAEKEAARRAEEDRLAAAALQALEEAKRAEIMPPERLESLGDALGTVVANMVIERAAAPTPVTAAGFASLERYTDPDPGAATKLPGEPVETMDAQEGAGLAEVAPLVQVFRETAVATLKLGDLCAWAGFTLTRAFVETLGIVPTIDGTKMLFTVAQRRELKAALLRHVEGLQA